MILFRDGLTAFLNKALNFCGKQKLYYYGETFHREKMNCGKIISTIWFVALDPLALFDIILIMRVVNCCVERSTSSPVSQILQCCSTAVRTASK